MSPGRRDLAAVGGTRAAALIAIICIGLLAACQTTAPSPNATVVAPSAASTPAPSTSDSPVEVVSVDPTLLSILPREVAGTLMLPAPENAMEIARDPLLVTEVEALAVALAVSDGASGSENIVIANVVRLQPDVFDEAFFEGWRTTYDEAACEPAGGVSGTAEGEMGGRPVFVATCLNGGSTYHARYGEDVIVSLTSTGEGRYGEIVMQHLGG